MDKTKINILSRGLSKINSNKLSITKKELISCSKMSSFDYINKSSCCNNNCNNSNIKEYIEVRFKNTRKEYFEVTANLQLFAGDIVSVDASPGYDIGIVTLTGSLAYRQMIIKSYDKNDIKKVFRKAKTSEIQTWQSFIEKEHSLLKKTRMFINDLRLNMKLNDVEYQGDGTKAIFYYTAEDRVDFRELIKLLAREFRLKVEMKQIGARQEASRIGGVGTCGRELCCSSWIYNLQSVVTNSARTQQLVLNPQKLAGQCTKLKCCLNHEYPVYFEALKNFPNNSLTLKTKKGDAIHIKSDIFQNLMWYSYKNDRSCILGLSTESVKEIIDLNKKNKIPNNLEDYAKLTDNIDLEDTVDQDDIKKMGLTDDIR